jgi:DNA-binding PadR family transcriptional regulator
MSLFGGRPSGYIGARYSVHRYSEGLAMAEGDSGTRLDLGRFAEPAVLVLVSLSGGPKHGYAIMTDVEEFSGVGIGPGTLYAVLARLEQAGLVIPMRSEDRRRPYRISESGAAALAAQLSDMGRFLRVGRARLRTDQSGRP